MERIDEIYKAESSAWQRIENDPPYVNALSCEKVSWDEDAWCNGFENGALWADEHPKSPWIKCSERMPPFINFGEYKRNDVSVNKEVIQKYEDTENVVVLYKNGDVDIDYCTLYTTVDIDNNKKIKKTYTWGKVRTDVLAWMPIPKYKKE